MDCTLAREEHRTAMPLWTIHHTSGTFTDEDSAFPY